MARRTTFDRMSSVMRPRHTTVVESLSTSHGTLVREDYYGYPQEESNVYMIDDNGTPIWFAERAMDNDAFTGSIAMHGPDRMVCGSWRGFTCEIDLRDGKIIKAEFTK
jgi:hypothetical protein